MKATTLTLTVITQDSVPSETVAQQIGDAIDPDGWNWDVSFPVVTGERTVPEQESYTVCERCGHPTPNGSDLCGDCIDGQHDPLDGTSGQDRESYTDEQDRESYTVPEQSTPDGVSLDSRQERAYWPGRPWGDACGLCDAGIPHTPGDCGKYAGSGS